MSLQGAMPIFCYYLLAFAEPHPIYVCGSIYCHLQAYLEPCLLLLKCYPCQLYMEILLQDVHQYLQLTLSNFCCLEV